MTRDPAWLGCVLLAVAFTLGALTGLALLAAALWLRRP